MTTEKGREVPLRSRRTSALEALMQDKRKHTHTQPKWVNEHTGWEVPQDTRKTIERYLEYGIDPGGFLNALFSDKLTDTFQYADEFNRESIEYWVGFVFWEMPHPAVGSKEKMQAHIEKGGYRCQE